MLLIYFIIQFPPVLLQLLVTYRLSNPIAFGEIYTLFFVMSKPIGGILFAAVFWSVGRSVNNIHIRDFMVMSAYGLILFFTSNQAIILDSFPFPPFGLVTISFVGLAALLLLVGIYSAALSMAHDSTLRASIRISLEESGLLDNIAASETERHILRKAVELTKSLSNAMEEESGVEPSLDEADIKVYLNEVIEEVRKKNINS